MIAARYINPYIRYINGSPVKFEYTLIIYDKDTQEILDRMDKKFSWEVTDAELEEFGIQVMNDYEVSLNLESGITLDKDTQVTLDWPANGPE